MIFLKVFVSVVAASDMLLLRYVVLHILIGLVSIIERGLERLELSWTPWDVV